MSEAFDLLLVGAGINGAGIARDAAGRGLSVLLVEKGDLAGATSSASSKLIHGGLRYLEHGDFRLVREGLAEREILLRTAPHLVRPLRFVMPLGPGSRPRWMLRAGLFLYDRLGGARSLPGAASLDLRSDPAGRPLLPDVRRGFGYYDCRTDDARLTIASARDAAARGASIMTRTALVSAKRKGEVWRARLCRAEGRSDEVAARVLVNAAGPWASDVQRRAGLPQRVHLRLVKGSHLVVPKLYEGEHAYLLQNDDGRVVFVIPFERDYSLIGTTEVEFAGDPDAAAISEAEAAYLCRAVARWFAAAPSPADVVWSYAGVRPLCEDRARRASAVSRDYVLELDAAGPPGLSVFGGKLTTYRRLAEHALERLAPFFPGMGPPWTAGAPLPGGEGLPAGGVKALDGELRQRYPLLAAAAAGRLAEAYGSEAAAMFAGGLGRDFGHGLSEAELRWLVEREWARTAEDVLWRRTKLGLCLSPEQARQVAGYLSQQKGAVPAAAGTHGSES